MCRAGGMCAAQAHHKTPPARHILHTPPARHILHTPPARHILHTTPARHILHTPPARHILHTPPARNKYKKSCYAEYIKSYCAEYTKPYDAVDIAAARQISQCCCGRYRSAAAERLEISSCAEHLVSKVITGSHLDSVAKIDRYIFILNCTISSSHMYMS